MRTALVATGQKRCLPRLDRCTHCGRAAGAGVECHSTLRSLLPSGGVLSSGFLWTKTPPFFLFLTVDQSFLSAILLPMSQDTVVQNDQALAYPAEASREMIEAGLFYGRKKSKTNPKMRQFILMNRGGIEIINLQRTGELVDEAMAFLKEKVRQGGLVLLVGTQPSAETALMRVSKRFSIPYVTTRWVGGAITNFNIISRRVEHLKTLRSGLASGALDKYTKKERLELEREMNRLNELMGGLETMSREPDLVVMVDPNLHHTALREARKKNIPVIALANVDADPDHITYPVPGNDKAKKSIEWFFEKVEKAIEEGLAMKAATPAPEATPKEGASAKGEAAAPVKE